MDILSGRSALRRWTIASIVGNMVLVVTGALVRLTKSGLGCPTWPQCDSRSYLPHPELGVHGAIEFGNRLLTFVLAAIAIGTLLAAYRARPVDKILRRLAVVAALGIPAQAVIGGLSVLSQLNPWVVALHLVASVALIMLCVAMAHRTSASAPSVVPATTVALTRVVFAIGLLVCALGAVVTGAGPNSGDGAAQRNGMSLEWTAKTHAVAVWALVAMTIWLVIRLRGHQGAYRAAHILLGIELLQGSVGYVQYFTHLPLGIVIAHMLGTALFSAALMHLLLSVRGTPFGGDRAPAQPMNSASTAAATKTSAR